MMKIFLTLICLTLLAAGARAQTATASQTSAPSADELAEASRLNAEAVHLFGQGRYDEAAPLAERVLEIKLKAYGPVDPGVAVAQYNLGMIRVGQRRFDEAEGLLRKALAVYEQRQQSTPAQELAKVLSGLAVVRAKLGHEDEALKLSQSALSTAEKALKPESAELADYYRQLADIYRLKRDYGKAEDSYLRAIEIWAKSAGPEDARAEMAVEALMCTAAGDGRNSGVWRKLGEVLKDADPSHGVLLDGKVVSKPPPSYPAAAKASLIMGSAVIKIWVDKEGSVERAKALCGHPLLAEASVEAARRARFTPTLLDGKPVKVSGYITYHFVLR